MSNANEALNPPGLPVRSTAMSKSSPVVIGSSASSGFVIVEGGECPRGAHLNTLGVFLTLPREGMLGFGVQTKRNSQARGWGDAPNLTLQGTATSRERLANWEIFGWICLDELEQSVGRTITLQA